MAASGNPNPNEIDNHPETLAPRSINRSNWDQKNEKQ
jgi:hypothetical protein